MPDSVKPVFGDIRGIMDALRDTSDLQPACYEWLSENICFGSDAECKRMSRKLANYLWNRLNG